MSETTDTIAQDATAIKRAKQAEYKRLWRAKFSDGEWRLMQKAYRDKHRSTPHGKAAHKAAEKKRRMLPHIREKRNLRKKKLGRSPEQKLKQRIYDATPKRKAASRAYKRSKYVPKPRRSKDEQVARQKEKHRLWAKTPEGRLSRRLSKKNRKHRKRAAKHNSPNPATPKQLRILLSAAEYCCYCHDPFDAGNPAKIKTLDHVVPICRGGAHSLENIVVACNQCNGRKSGMEPSEWFGKIEVFKACSDL